MGCSPPKRDKQIKYKAYKRDAMKDITSPKLVLKEKPAKDVTRPVIPK